MLATLVDKPFDSDEWLFEIKWDGYRALAFVDNNKVSLLSRNENSFNELFPEIVNELKKQNIQAVLDGAKGIPKALILVSKHYTKKMSAIDTKLDMHQYAKIANSYNTCIEVFANEEEFAKAIIKHSKDTAIQLLFIKAHGKQNSITIDDGLKLEYPSEFRDNRLIEILSNLGHNANIILSNCQAGKGRNSLVRYFYFNARLDTTVYGSIDDYFNFQLVLSKDVLGNIKAGFWGYKNISRLNDPPLSANIIDYTYVADWTSAPHHKVSPYYVYNRMLLIFAVALGTALLFVAAKIGNCLARRNPMAWHRKTQK